MIDNKSLATFLTSPDADEIIKIFSAFPAGALRTSALAHLTVMSQCLGTSIQSPPKAEQPFVASTLEGRVVERKLRNQRLDIIASAENITVERVRMILRKAARDGVKVGRIAAAKKSKSDKPKRATTPSPQKAAFVQLRLLGMGPKEIGKKLNVGPGQVSNAVYEARTAGTIFPPVNPDLLFDADLTSAPMADASV